MDQIQYYGEGFMSNPLLEEKKRNIQVIPNMFDNSTTVDFSCAEGGCIESGFVNRSV